MIGCGVGLVSALGWPSSRGRTPPPARVRRAAPSPLATAVPAEAQGAPAERLASIVGQVPAATGATYSTKDDQGHSLDTLKVIAGPSGVYLGVYHFTDQSGIFTTAVATSSDLKQWTYKATLAVHASQPALTSLSDGGYAVAVESDQETQGKRSRSLRFLHYASLEALLRAAPDQSFDAPRTLGGAQRGAEGTPNFYGSEPSALKIGFHYLAPGGVDREAVGVLTNFTGWTTRRDGELDDALTAAGALGKHGDRDCVTFADRQLVLVEAQRYLDGAWELYVYDRTAQSAQYVPVTTPGSSLSFANPSVTVVKGPDGTLSLVVGLFLPLSGAATDEAGELVSYRNLAPGTALGHCD